RQKVIDHCVDAAWIRRRNSDSGLADARRRQASRHRTPRRAAVSGLEQAATRSVRRLIRVPSGPTRVPQRGVDVLRVRRIDHDVDGANVVALEQDFVPRAPAVGSLVDATIWTRLVEMTDGGDKDDVRILRIDCDLADVLAVVEAGISQMRPR